ncbi:MAG: response regulator transcription factor [Actinomycetota bacterium]|nr:response regulator transcription factor [Actinomycetota bacterium]
MMHLPIRIVVVDDHNLFRAGVIELLQSVPDFEIVTEGASGIDAITIALDVKPDIIILDVEMPGPGAKATIHKVLEVSPTTKIIILTMHDDPELVRELFEAGAAGYLLKSAGRTELIAAISAASRAEDSVLVSVSRATVISLGRSAQPHSDLLSPRELEVLLLLADGRSNRDIAASLYISSGTVKRHLTNIYGKLGASSRLDAVRKADQLGISARRPAGVDEPAR